MPDRTSGSPQARAGPCQGQEEALGRCPRPPEQRYRHPCFRRMADCAACCTSLRSENFGGDPGRRRPPDRRFWTNAASNRAMATLAATAAVALGSAWARLVSVAEGKIAWQNGHFQGFRRQVLLANGR